MTNFEVIKGLEISLELEGKSDSTRERYTAYIKKMISYFGYNVQIDKLTDDELRKYALYLHEKGYSPRTYNCHIAAIKYVYNKVIFKGINYNKIPFKRVKGKEHEVPTTEEVGIMLRACDDLEIKCAIYLASGSGLRISEISKVKVGDINSIAGKLRVVGKGNKERYTIISKEVIIELRKYYKYKREKIEGNEYLFARKNYKGHIKSDYIGRKIKEITKKAKISNYTAHGLRRYFATTVYEETKDYEALAAFMGHDSLETAKKYPDIKRREYKIKTPISKLILEQKGIIANETNTRDNRKYNI